MDKGKYVQLYIRKSSVITTRLGPYTGMSFAGHPSYKLDPTVLYKSELIVNQNEMYYMYTYDSPIFLVRSVTTPDGKVEFQNTDSLNFFNHYLDDENLSDDPNDEKRDKEPKKSDGIDLSSLGGTEKPGDINKDERVHPGASGEATNDESDNATLEENVNQSEGDDSYYNEFNNLFNDPVNVTPDRQNTFRTYIRRSARKTQMPVKLSDYEGLDVKLCYS
ncbi:S-locus glycoprotein domain-containing protein [Artemisia annua]|uniref:S-locus glycoprotein domain-containing protein n=1 Tax=Artemisia annua TaxID=35608 RepID=A0A2U1ML07_ARTAN|nr:S-locus glycoprotein domain-containing protein [Artemisia annua]